MSKFLCNLDHFYVIAATLGRRGNAEKPFEIEFFNIHNDDIHTVSFRTAAERDKELLRINTQKMFFEVKS